METQEGSAHGNRRVTGLYNSLSLDQFEEKLMNEIECPCVEKSSAGQSTCCDRKLTEDESQSGNEDKETSLALVKREPREGEGDAEEEEEEDDEDEDDDEETRGGEKGGVHSRPSSVSSPSPSSLAKNIFGQVKYLEDTVLKLEKDLEEKRREVESLKVELDNERKSKAEMMESKRNEIDNLNDEMEEERKAKEILELKWKRMGKNMINLYSCFTKLMDLHSDDNRLFKPLPDLKDRQEGTMNLVKKLLQIFHEKIDEGRRNQMEIERQRAEMQEELDRAHMLELIAPKRKKRIAKFNPSPPIVTRSRSVPGQLTPSVLASPTKRKGRMSDTNGALKKQRSEDQKIPVFQIDDSDEEKEEEVSKSVDDPSEAGDTEQSTSSSPPHSDVNVEDDEDVEEEEGEESPDVEENTEESSNNDSESQDDDAKTERTNANAVVRKKQLVIELIRLEDEDDFVYENKGNVNEKSGEVEIKPEITPVDPPYQENSAVPLPDSTSASPPPTSPTLTPMIEQDASSVVSETIRRVSNSHLPPKKRRQFSVVRVVREHSHDVKRNGFYCICGTSFTQRRYLQSHVQYYTCYNNLPCSRCDQTFSRLGQLKRHLATTHNQTLTENLVACRACSTVFSSRWELQNHRQTHHSTSSQSNANPDPIPTPKKRRKKRRVRQVRPRPVNSVRQQVAADSTTTLSELGHGWDFTKRIRRTADKRFPCFCGVRFQSKTKLNDHVKYHTLEWKHKCDICKKKFSRQWFLNKHLETARHKKKVNGTATAESGAEGGRDDEVTTPAATVRRHARNARKPPDSSHVDEEVIDWYLSEGIDG